MDTILKTKNLCKYYGNGENEVKALQDVNIEIERGEFVAVVGKSGSGKSTLIQHFNGLLKPTSGQILINGTDLWGEKTNIREYRFKVGLVFQYPEYQLFEETVYKDIAFVSRAGRRACARGGRLCRAARRVAGQVSV